MFAEGIWTLRFATNWWAAAICVNQDVAAAYLEAVDALRKQFEISTRPDFAAILRLPGVIGPAAALLDEDFLVSKPNRRCLAEAIDKLDRMREQEGSRLFSPKCLDGFLGITSLTAKLSAGRAVPARRLRARLQCA